MLSSSSSSPSLSVFTKPSSSSKKPAKRAKAKARPLPTPPSFHQNSRSDQQVTAPTINKNSPLHLTYKLKPDSPFQNYTTPKTVIPAKASQHVKRTTVHSKLSENPILSETKKISYMLHPPPDPQYFTSFLESTIPKSAQNRGGEPYFLSSEPTPLEIAIDNCVTLRESYLLRLKGLTANKRNIALLNDKNESIHTLTEDAQILMVEISDLLTLIRHSTIEFVENIKKWRNAHNKPYQPYLVDGKNYLATLSSDLNFLDSFSLLSRWIGARMTRNPMVLRNGLDERLESIRNYEDLPPIMNDIKFVDEGNDAIGEQNKDLIVNDNGTVRRGGLVEKMRLLEMEKEKNKEKTSRKENNTEEKIDTGDFKINPEVSVTIAITSLDKGKPSDFASLAIKHATLALNRSNEKHDNEDKIPSPSKHARTAPKFYKNATTFNNPSTLIALRFLHCERIILQEEAIYSPGSLTQALDKIARVPPFVVPLPPPHYPFLIEEDKVKHRLENMDKSLKLHHSYALKIEVVIKKQIAIIPSLRLQLYWSRRIKRALEDQEAGRSSTGSSVLEKMPWTMGDIDQNFASAWSGSAEFRQKMTYEELLRLERLAFATCLEQSRKTIEEIESEIAALQGIIAGTVHMLEDHNIKVETCMNRRKNCVKKLEELIEKRRGTNQEKEVNWIRNTRWMLPVPVPALVLEKRWEKERLKEKHNVEWWIDKYTRPEETGMIDLSRVRRSYERPWVQVKADGTPVFEVEDFEEEAKDPAKVLVGGAGLQRTIGKTKNKYACYSVYRGGFKVSKMFSMVHVIRKPPRGYSLGGYIVACFCTRASKPTGKLSDLPDVVTKEFVGDVLKVFKEHHPTLATAGVRDGDAGERDEWKNWCRHLKLAREILPDGRVSGKVKLIWSMKEVEGEIWKSLLEEGEEEALDTRHPVGKLWRGGMKLPVMSISHVTYRDEEEVDGNGMKVDDLVSKADVGIYVPPSKVFNYIGERYYIATIEGYRGKGYELSGFTIRIFDPATGENIEVKIEGQKGEKNKGKGGVSWNTFKDMGWDTGKFGKKETKDLVEFLKGGVVMREANGREHWEYFDRVRVEETKHLYSSENAVLGGKTAILEVRGLHDTGLLGFGRTGGIRMRATLVWEGVLRDDLELDIGLNELRRSGYKCGWTVEDDGRLNFHFEPHHMSKFLRTCMFVFDDGDRNMVRLDWAPSKKPLFKMMGYIGGEFCCSSIIFFFGSLQIRVFVVSSGYEDAIEVDESMLVRCGRRDIARNVANSTKEGLRAILEALAWSEEGKLYLTEPDIPDDDDIHVGKCLLRTAMRLENELHWAKISVFNYNKQGSRGIKGDDGLVVDLIPRDKGNEAEEKQRCVLERETLLVDYNIVLIKNGGVGKDLSRIPISTLRGVLGQLRAESMGSSML